MSLFDEYVAFLNSAEDNPLAAEDIHVGMLVKHACNPNMFGLVLELPHWANDPSWSKNNDSSQLYLSYHQVKILWASDEKQL